MSPTRRERIEQMLQDEPEDTFLRYSLAMDWNREGEHERSLELHRELMKSQPPYVPSFFMAAQQLVDLDRVEEARTLLREGIEHARNQGDSHAAGEMSEYLASLGSLG